MPVIGEVRIERSQFRSIVSYEVHSYRFDIFEEYIDWYVCYSEDQQCLFSRLRDAKILANAQKPAWQKKISVTKMEP